MHILFAWRLNLCFFIVISLKHNDWRLLVKIHPHFSSPHRAGAFEMEDDALFLGAIPISQWSLHSHCWRNNVRWRNNVWCIVPDICWRLIYILCWSLIIHIYCVEELWLWASVHYDVGKRWLQDVFVLFWIKYFLLGDLIELKCFAPSEFLCAHWIWYLKP